MNAVRMLVIVGVAQCVPPSPTSIITDELKDEFTTVKTTIKLLSDQWEKWNALFITSLEPRITSTASTLASIDSNIHNLQERAHVWDTFQLHVAAWNDQLASMDRKIDIISKGQEKMLSLDNKINSILSIEYKLDSTIKLLGNVQETVTNLDSNLETKGTKTGRDSLLNEFTTRGVLSSIKMVEKKLDRLLLINQNHLLKPRPNEKPKWQIKCNTPKVIEELLNDISSKVDVIFDSVNVEQKDPSDEYDEYIDLNEGSGEIASYKIKPEGRSLRNVLKKAMQPCKQTNQALEEILHRTVRIQNTSLVILDSENTHFEKLIGQHPKRISVVSELIQSKYEDLTKNVNIILDSYFSEQRVHFENILSKMNRKHCEPKPTQAPSTTTNFLTDEIFEVTTASSNIFEATTEITQQPTWRPILDETKTSCEDLSYEDSSGVYVFGNNSEDPVNKFYCDIRDDGLWTVIQRRDNYGTQHNFNVSWEQYKRGFGDLHKDFWMGNEFLNDMSKKHALVLRVELEDFEDNSAWAEYNTFKVDPEENEYRITLAGYKGNASDSFSNHSGSFFSTFDRKNDEAPECCPCAMSYGGGWWFNKCFESNLNGVYHKQPNVNDYFRGIIWEHWLGNYSLKRSVMMVKSRGTVYTNSKVEEETGTNVPFFEEP